MIIRVVRRWMFHDTSTARMNKSWSSFPSRKVSINVAVLMFDEVLRELQACVRRTWKIFEKIPRRRILKYYTKELFRIWKNKEAKSKFDSMEFSSNGEEENYLFFFN